MRNPTHALALAHALALGLALVLATSLVGGCGGDDEQGADAGATVDAGVLDDAAAGDAAAPITPAALCAELNERLCAGLEACACRFDVRPYDADGCVEARTAECIEGFAARVEPDIAAGRAAVDAPSVARCLEAVEAMTASCTLAPDGLPAACASLVVDTAAEGEECTVSGGLAFCAGATGICAPAEVATCTALPGDGDTCLAGFCAQGLTCDGDVCGVAGASGDDCVGSTGCADGLICTPAGACAAPLAADAACTETGQCAEGLVVCEGEACTAGTPLGEGCNSPPACGAARSCGRAPETRVCAAPDALGEPCSDETCGAGLACDGTTGLCATLPGDGDPCLNGFACAAGLACADGEGLCRPLPGQGETCFAGARFCADGLGCDFGDNTCQAGGGAGSECLLNPPDYVCGEGLGCDFGAEGSICIPIGGAGSPCNSDRTCSADTFCDFSTLACAPRYAAGTPCSAGNECAVGDECFPGAGGYACAPIPGLAEPCFFDCDDGLACKGPGGACVAALCVLP